MAEEKKTSVLSLTSSQIASRVLVVGDPARATKASLLLRDVHQVANVREYLVYTGTTPKGTRVTVASHGVGASGTSVIMEELLQCGAEVILRAGTCGVFPKDVKPGDHVIVTGAVREDGTSSYLIPVEYPAVADFSLVHALLQSCQKRKEADESYRFCHGICQTIASLYPGPLGRELKLWEKAGVVAQDMETSLIFVMASMRRVRAGCILTADCNVNNDYAEEYDPYSTTVADAKKEMLLLALEALESIV